MKTLSVKVLGMTDGRVEKIEYNGDIYKLIPDGYPSIKGDICSNRSETFGSWEIGMYFENIAEDSEDYPLPQGGDKGVYMDDEANLHRDNCDVFRKERDFKAGDIVFSMSRIIGEEGLHEVSKDQNGAVIRTTIGELLSIEDVRLATHNEKYKFYEERKLGYIEISPFKAYEYYFNGKKVYCRYGDSLGYRNVRERDLSPPSVKLYETEFYIKGES